MDLVRLCALLPTGPLQPDRSAPVSTPVTSARRQLKSNPRLWLACSAATHSFNAVNGAHASVALALAANSPRACNLGVSFFSISLLLAFASVELLSFLTHLMGLSECELCEDCVVAPAAPAPAGPCAAARSAPTDRNSERPNAKNTTRNHCFFIFYPSVERFAMRREAAARGLFPVSHRICVEKKTRKEGTTPIGHAGRSNRCPRSRTGSSQAFQGSCVIRPRMRRE